MSKFKVGDLVVTHKGKIGVIYDIIPSKKILFPIIGKHKDLISVRIDLKSKQFRPDELQLIYRHIS